MSLQELQQSVADLISAYEKSSEEIIKCELVAMNLTTDYVEVKYFDGEKFVIESNLQNKEPKL